MTTHADQWVSVSDVQRLIAQGGTMDNRSAADKANARMVERQAADDKRELRRQRNRIRLIALAIGVAVIIGLLVVMGIIR